MALKERIDHELDRLLQKREAEVRQPPKEYVRSHQEQAEHEGAEAFAEGLRADGASIRGFAKRVHRDESLIRAYLSGAKAVPVAIMKRLNQAGQFAAWRMCIKNVPQTDESERSSEVATDEGDVRRSA